MKKILGVLLFIVMIGQPIGIWAQDDRIIVPVSLDLTDEDKFTYEVRVSEGGYLIDGSQRITNGTVAYELSVGEKKKFRIETDRGYEVKEISRNNELIDKDIDEIEIAGVSGKSVLEVKYGKVEEEANPPIPDIPPPDEGEEPEVPAKDGAIEESKKSNGTEKGNGIERIIPITSDMLRISEYVCLMLIVLYRIYVSKRGIFMQRHVDNKEKEKL